jgi:toxin-antitoxin system PIN domain toxin
MSAEPALIDTNVLVYALFAERPEHAASLALVESAQDPGANLVIAPQNLAEFYAVVSNPRRVSTPLSANDARVEVEKLTRLPGLRLLDVPVDVVTRWHALLGRYPVTGRAFYDIQLVAVMLAHDIRRIYTFDRKDFVRFTELELLTPAVVAP